MGTGKPESGWTGDLIGIIALSRLDFGIRDKLRGFVAKTDPSLQPRWCTLARPRAKSVHTVSESLGLRLTSLQKCFWSAQSMAANAAHSGSLACVLQEFAITLLDYFPAQNSVFGKNQPSRSAHEHDKKPGGLNAGHGSD
jgi:hypothetical protein